MTTEQAIIAELRAQNEALRAQNEKLQAEIIWLKERLGLNAENSSIPPSQKPVRKSKLSPLGSRKRGGQPGHPGVSREALPLEAIDRIVSCPPPVYCSCGGELEPTGEYVSQQQYVLPEIQIETIAYQRQKAVCTRCAQTQIAPLPPGTAPGLSDNRLLSWAAILGTEYKLSKQKLSRLFEQLLGLKIAPSTLSQQERYLQAALNPIYCALKAEMRNQAVQYIDETSFRQGNGDRQNPEAKQAWLWVQTSPLLTVFTLALSRGQKVLEELLGPDFVHKIVSDRFGAYEILALSQRGVCWAHLIRDFLRISERSAAAGELGEALVSLSARVFAVRARYLSGELAQTEFFKEMDRLRNELIELLESGVQLTGARRSENARTARTCQNLLKLETALWRFVETAGMEPTNNAAERALRPLVTQRKVLYGTQSERGSRFQERMHSVIATCKQQGKSAVDICTQSLQAYFGHGQIPSLLPG